MSIKPTIILGLLGSLAASGAAFAGNKIKSNEKNQSVSAEVQARITKEEARKIALEKVEGEIVDEEYEKEDGKMVYGFEIKQPDGTIMEVKIDEMSGKIIYFGKDDGDKDEKDENGDDDDTNSMVSNGAKTLMSEREDGEESKQKSEATLMRRAKITKATAEKIAVKRAAGKVEEGELEMENGKLVYSFDIRNRKGTITEVQVDAKTGKIVSVEEENAAQEAAEKAQEKP